MNYVISGINTKRRQYTDMKDGDPDKVAAINERMLTIDEYQNLARRIIGKWAPAHAKTAMLASDDAVDYVAYLIMMGDWGYDPDKSNMKTYRGYCGKKAISNYLGDIVKQGAATNFLDGTVEQEGGIYDIIPDEKCLRPDEPMEIVERRDEARRDLMIYMGGLNDTQKKCVMMHHIQGIPMADIAREIGMSREGVRRSIEEAMKTMRTLAGVRYNE